MPHPATLPEPGPAALPVLHPAAPPVTNGSSRRTFLRGAPTVTKVKNLTGAGLTSQWGVGATDLGIPAVCPDGRRLWVFGDTWTDTVGGTNWRSPVALYSGTTNLAGGVTFNGAVGGSTAQQL